MNKVQAIVLSVIAAAAIGLGVTVPFGVSENTSETGTDNGAPANNQTGPGSDEGGFVALPDSSLPSVDDSGLRVEKVAEGLAMPTSMAFLDSDDLLITQKDNGRVRHILDGRLQDEHIHDVFVSKVSERGLLGVAVAEKANSTEKTVFLYYTEDNQGDIRNRVYSYNWTASSGITGATLLLDLPGTPGPNHDGGKVIVGPDNMLYAVIGDLNRDGMLQNFRNGNEPDDTSVILRVAPDGAESSQQILSHESEDINESLGNYFAYGIRNSFGIDFDPVTGNLWDTENGPSDYDEINLVLPGFNSGWQQVMGPIERSGMSESDLLAFNGSHYRDPAFSWHRAQGVTDIEFLNSTALGSEYVNNIFVGDINNGNLYYFKVNEARDGLSFDASGLEDLVADNNDEVDSVTFGTGFEGITDLETGPDGYLYILTFGGNLYRIVPNS